MDIASGRPEGHESLLPLDASGIPAVAPVTPVFGQLTPADQTPAFDAAADQVGRLGGYEADIRAAQATGQNARNAMLSHYGADVLPVGASYGDPMALPVVPDNALPPASSGGYPYSGDEPVVPPSAGFPGYPG
jgi:hypothetical protein